MKGKELLEIIKLRIGLPKRDQIQGDVQWILREILADDRLSLRSTIDRGAVRRRNRGTISISERWCRFSAVLHSSDASQY